MVPLPPGPTEDEIAAYAQVTLDRTWVSTGLDGTVDRPVVQSGATLGQGDWFTAMFACMQQEGYLDVGIGTSSEAGAALYDSSGLSIDDPVAQLAFYKCAAAHPIELSSEYVVMSEKQLDYIYDYYASWLVPCVVDHGYLPRGIPSRSSFHESQGLWSPYNVERLTERDRVALVDACGSDQPLAR